MESSSQCCYAGLPGAAQVKLAFGLGNPEAKYEATRHNVGAKLAKSLAEKRGLVFSKAGKLPASVAGTAGTVRLSLTETYMNESGDAVARLAGYLDVRPASVLVIHDELDLACGVARYKFGGGVAGHRGLEDVKNKLGTDSFWRLRIGVGHPRNLEGDLSTIPPEKYVLAEPFPEQLALIEACLEKAQKSWELVEACDMDGAIKLLHTENQGQV